MCQCTLLPNINIKRAQKTSIRVAKAVILTRGLRLEYSPSQENEKMRGACLLEDLSVAFAKRLDQHLFSIYFHFLCAVYCSFDYSFHFSFTNSFCVLFSENESLERGSGGKGANNKIAILRRDGKSVANVVSVHCHNDEK